MKNKNHIFLAGTSSVGKTSVSTLFEKLGYKHIGCDNVKYDETLSHNIDLNTYYTDEQLDYENYSKRMFEDGISEEKVVYDDTELDIISLYKNTSKDLLFVLMYASPTVLIDNILQRRFYQKRGKYVFKNFTNFYKLASNNDKIIDHVNKKIFRNKLLDKCKYLFSSEEKLYLFVDDMFKDLDDACTNDDEFYPICLRNQEHEYDLCINIEGKTVESIFQTIQTLN